MRLSDNWREFIKQVKTLNEKQLAKKLDEESRDKCRPSYIERLYSQYTRLRKRREMKKLLNKEGL